MMMFGCCFWLMKRYTTERATSIWRKKAAAYVCLKVGSMEPRPPPPPLQPTSQPNQPTLSNKLACCQWYNKQQKNKKKILHNKQYAQWHFRL